MHSKIRYYMSLRNLTIKEIAKNLNISRTQLSKKINGHNELKLSEIIEILKLLNVEFDDLFTDKKIKEV